MQNKTKALTVLADTNTRESLTLVGVTRLELVASWTRTMHATKLRYTPTSAFNNYTRFILFVKSKRAQFTCKRNDLFIQAVDKLLCGTS